MALTTGQETAIRERAATPDARPRPLAARRRFPEPAYLHIANTIAEQIGAGVYRPGDQLPTEAATAQPVRRQPHDRAPRHQHPPRPRPGHHHPGQGHLRPLLDLGEAVFRLQAITDMWTTTTSVDVSLLEARIVPADERVAGCSSCAVTTHRIHAPAHRPRRGAAHLSVGARGLRRAPAPGGGPAADHVAGRPPALHSGGGHARAGD